MILSFCYNINVMKKFFKEFKEFALRGNVVDLAVGVVIGTSFSAIVNSLVNDIVMPLISSITSDVNFTDLKVTLKIVDDNVITLNYGSFIQTLFNFIIVAFCIFAVIKAMNEIRDKISKGKSEEETVNKSAELIELEKIRELLSKNK